MAAKVYMTFSQKIFCLIFIQREDYLFNFMARSRERIESCWDTKKKRIAIAHRYGRPRKVKLMTAPIVTVGA